MRRPYVPWDCEVIVVHDLTSTNRDNDLDRKKKAIVEHISTYYAMVIVDFCFPYIGQTEVNMLLNSADVLVIEARMSKR